jgi:hypothetical protein
MECRYDKQIKTKNEKNELFITTKSKSYSTDYREKK